MRVLRSVWRLLLGIKDALVLVVLLLFFGGLFAALSARPNAGSVTDGALVLRFNGAIVEQPAPVQVNAFVQSQRTREYRLRDVVTAIDAARNDPRVKAVVLDLDGFLGAGRVSLGDIAGALDRVRQSGKPVYAFATGYTDGSYYLAAHASQIWLDPMGLALFAGPGGSQPYFKGLIDRLGINAHIYRVGKYKSFVEPYTRSEASPEARQANAALAGALFANWQADVQRVRPKAQLARYLGDPAGATAASANLADAALANGIVDRVASRAAFGRMVAKIAGPGRRGAEFAAITLPAFIAAHPYDSGDGAIGVATVAGNIVDGQADPGTAGGDTIAQLIEEGTKGGRLKALVLRVDSPGGSALASDRIREALLAAKAHGLPVVVSMANVAASGGYWVTTAADRVFAEPSTITGSIGVFGIIPTFENAIGKIGVTRDGVRTTPLSGQPDLLAGTNPAFDAIIQRSVEATYGRFVTLVSQSRGMPVARVNELAQGRVWDGGSARQLGLVDQFGSLDDAIAHAARLAKLNPAARHAVWLEKPQRWTDRLAEGWFGSDDEGAADAVTMLAHARMAELGRALDDARTLASGSVLQARCLECEPVGGSASPTTLFGLLEAWLLR